MWLIAGSGSPTLKLNRIRLTYSNIFHFEAKMKRKDHLEAKRSEKIEAKQSEMKQKNWSCVFA
jgi:hypothetical protein